MKPSSTAVFPLFLPLPGPTASAHPPSSVPGGQRGCQASSYQSLKGKKESRARYLSKYSLNR